jgi:hypothetical protein
LMANGRDGTNPYESTWNTPVLSVVVLLLLLFVLLFLVYEYVAILVVVVPSFSKNKKRIYP